MKAYIGNVDWADEGDVFFFSVESEEKLAAMKELISIFMDLDILGRTTAMYWGSNEWFDFDWEELEFFIDEAKNVSDDELAVFHKFHISGFDIYDRIEGQLLRNLSDCDFELTQEELDKIKPAFLKIFDKRDWDNVLQDQKQ